MKASALAVVVRQIARSDAALAIKEPDADDDVTRPFSSSIMESVASPATDGSDGAIASKHAESHAKASHASLPDDSRSTVSEAPSTLPTNRADASASGVTTPDCV